VAHFFSVYKDLESGEVVGHGWDGMNEAYEEIQQAADRYREHVREKE
jgi:inorganic pyrophosphatase